MGGTPARGGGDPARRGGDRGEAAGLHDRADPALAATGALVLRRRGSQAQRGQVLQAADARGLPARRLRDRRGALTAFGAGLLCRGRASAGTLWPTAPRVWLEDSPSPVYGAALLMRLGVTTLRGSNPRSSAARRPSPETRRSRASLTRQPKVAVTLGWPSGPSRAIGSAGPRPSDHSQGIRRL